MREFVDYCATNHTIRLIERKISSHRTSLPNDNLIHKLIFIFSKSVRERESINILDV